MTLSEKEEKQTDALFHEKEYIRGKNLYLIFKKWNKLIHRCVVSAGRRGYLFAPFSRPRTNEPVSNQTIRSFTRLGFGATQRVNSHLRNRAPMLECGPGMKQERPGRGEGVSGGGIHGTNQAWTTLSRSHFTLRLSYLFFLSLLLEKWTVESTREREKNSVVEAWLIYIYNSIKVNYKYTIVIFS